MAAGLLIVGASEIATLAGGPRRGAAQADAGVLRDAAHSLSVAVVDGSIHALGTEEEVRRRLAGEGVDATTLQTIDAQHGLVTPGLIDPHTHLLFGGTRERELDQRQSGASYLEILAAGGGILSTVERTREATEEELRAQGRRWLREMLSHGVTTIEAKSGYGLDAETELRLLAVAAELDREGPVEVVPTYLGAHAVPREMRDLANAADAYLADVVEKQLPRVAEQGIARFCDVFCELGVFDAAQSRLVLEAAARLGLRPRLHADEIHDSGGAALAAELGAASADHLAAVSDAGIEALGRAADDGHPVVATLLPATTLYLMSEHHAPARRLIERGVPVAIGTDFNPGTSPTPNLALVLSIACVTLGLTAAEALVAATVNAALALGLEATHGTIEPGRAADLVVWDVPSVDLLPYWMGANLARIVVKRGRVVRSSEHRGADPSLATLRNE
jgi:imidazolonepropionase